MSRCGSEQEQSRTVTCWLVGRGTSFPCWSRAVTFLQSTAEQSCDNLPGGNPPLLEQSWHLHQGTLAHRKDCSFAGETVLHLNTASLMLLSGHLSHPSSRHSLFSDCQDPFPFKAVILTLPLLILLGFWTLTQRQLFLLPHLAPPGGWQTDSVSAPAASFKLQQTCPFPSKPIVKFFH